MTKLTTSRLPAWLRSPAMQYLAVVTGVAIATIVRLPFEPWLQGRAPYGLYFPLLALSAWFFGVGPTGLAAILSPATAWFVFTRDTGAGTETSYVASLGVYLATATSLIWLALQAASTRELAEQGTESVARLAAIVTSSDDAIISKDLDGIVRSWNRGAQRIFGYAPEEMIGQSIERLIPAERRSEEQLILATLRRGDRVDHFETVRVAKDGRRLDISLSVSPVRDGSGEIIGAAKIARDVTEQRKTERALAEQREWFRITLASIGDGVITVDREGLVTFMNPTAERLTGWPEADAKGRPITEVFHIVNEQTRQPVDNPTEKAIRSGRVLGLANHTALIGKDGKEYPIEDSAAPIVDDEKNIIGAILVFHDVTERRRAEAAIAEQREWLETTLVSIGDAVIATDIHGRVVFMNPVAEHLTGWSSASAKGRECSEIFNIVNESTRVTVESPVARVLREGVVVGLANHTALIAKDGSERPIDDSAAPIRGGEGRITGVVLVFHDVSERRVAENHRRESARERDQLLQSERAARADAERANRVKDDFLATLSHELRTPLNAILGWTEILRRSSHDANTLARGINVIERNTRLQASLLSDLLDVSRIVSGKMRIELQLVDFPVAVVQAIETVKADADAKRIRIDSELASGFDPIVGDAVRLQQVAWNLLSNAVKFSPQGSVVRVRVEREGNHVKLTVSDQGVGIPPEFVPHLFDRFRQADASITRSFGGLGLGLTIVKQLIELHGGTVSAHSEGDGKGATFTVRLPLDSNREGLQPVSLIDAASQLSNSRLEGLRVLMVEDDPDSRELTERLLNEARCVVTSVETATAAFEALRRERPDVLISDLGLPGEDGYSLIQRVRRLDRAAGGAIPAIALTAFARAEDRTRALRAGFQAHVTKPVDAAELLATVASLAGVLAAPRAD